MTSRLLRYAFFCSGLAVASPAEAELPRYSVSLVEEVYPGLQLPIEMPAGLTAGNEVFTGNSLAGQAYAVTLPGGARTDIPVIPAALGYGDTGGNRIYNDIGGFVASKYNNTFESNSTEHVPHVYEPGSGWTSLGKPQGVNAIVTALNNPGQVLAAGLDGHNDESSAWRYTPGTGWLNLGNLGHSSGYALGRDMNDAGTVVGRSMDTLGNTRPFYYTEAGAMQPITDQGSALLGEAVAISDSGLITGNASGRAFIFNAQTLEFRFVTEPGGLLANDINSAGAIIGASHFGGTGTIFGVPVDTAFYWDADTGLTGFEQLLGDQVNDWFITDATDINDNGWILGTGFRRSDNTYHRVLLRPVPEPGAALLLGCGVLAAFRRRRT